MATPIDQAKACVSAWEAMPDALHGALPEPQAGWLAAHLETCAACSEQFLQQQRLQRAMALPVDLPLDVDAGLQRLLARLDQPEAVETVAPAARSTGPWGRALVAAMVLQAIGLGVMGVRLWSLDQPPAYRTLSEATPAIAAGAITLVPDPAMTVGGWDALLHEHALRVVAGPNAAGAYVVRETDGGLQGEALLQRLRTTPGILLAEPAAAAR
jgi:hypothetical protein